MFFPLGLVSSFSPLWSEKMLDMISVFLNLLTLALCLIMWSIFENVPCTPEKGKYGKRENLYRIKPQRIKYKPTTTQTLPVCRYPEGEPGGIIARTR